MFSDQIFMNKVCDVTMLGLKVSYTQYQDLK